MGPAIKGIENERLKFTLLNRLESDPIHIHFNQLRPRSFGFLPKVENEKSLWFSEFLQSVKHRSDLPEIIDLKTYLPDAMLYKVDRASMASSLEIRVPYLDNSVIDFALRLSLSQKSTPSFLTKAPLKSLLTKLAPHYQMLKTKKGFSFPLDSWLRNEWKTMVLDSVTKSTLDELGLPGDKMMKIVNAFYTKGANHLYEVWFLFNLTMWYSSFKSKLQSIK
jgi:asparagine synthase (glutamine-hydrolysing)